MKAGGFVLLLAICAIECRKIVQISKNANVDFINMESGGGGKPNYTPAARPATPVLHKPEPPKTPVIEQPKPVTVKPVVTTAKPIPVPITPVPSRPVQPYPVQGQSSPVKPPQAPAVSTPGYGSVKQLVTYYDSKGQASVIRPYSYSQAVKQG